MARLPYADLTHPDVSPLVDQIVAERGSVLHLYQMLLQSPPVAQGWLSHLTGIRQKTLLPGSLRELVIVRVALLNRAPYEADQHVPIALQEGITQAQIDDLNEWRSSTLFSEKERATLDYTDAMTRHVQVPDDIYLAVQQQFTPRELVELTATVATYNMVSRFLEALQIHGTDERA